jgi:predicted O-methyltransferase YrrM
MPPDELLKEMEIFAAEKKIPILDWKAAEFMEQLILISRPGKVLEIGTAIGYSSIRIAGKLRKGSSLDTIEKSMNNIVLAEKYIKRSGLKSRINILKGEALDIIPALDDDYDFIFLDADKHDYEKLFVYSLMILRKGGILFVDNLLWHGYAASGTVPASYRRSAKLIREFNTMFVNESTLNAAIFPIGDGIGVGIKI